MQHKRSFHTSRCNQATHTFLLLFCCCRCYYSSMITTFRRFLNFCDEAKRPALYWSPMRRICLFVVIAFSFFLLALQWLYACFRRFRSHMSDRSHNALILYQWEGQIFELIFVVVFSLDSYHWLSLPCTNSSTHYQLYVLQDHEFTVLPLIIMLLVWSKLGYHNIESKSNEHTTTTTICPNICFGNTIY